MARFPNTLLATTALMPIGIMAAAANPLGSQVVGGTANVQGQGTPAVTVTQTTNRAIINWQTFNIGNGETTQFVQPNSSSVTLNRVIGNLGASAINGTLTANGRVFLVNPDGILFGAGSKVNTGSFLATTNDIRNADFMAGRYQFNIPGRPDASIVNLGTITAQNGGFAALVAPGIRNTGTITANLGTVGLATSNNFSLDFYGDRLITLDVNDSIAAKVIDVATGQPLNALLQNDGKLKANGGRVELSAAAARQVVDSVINNTGVIEANSIGTKNGMIVLGAATAATKPAGTPTQTIKLSGTISAAGKRKNTKGGIIVVSGENIQLTSATVDASGQLGGGKVLIGGDVGGGNGNAAVAANPIAGLESFSIATASTIRVDAATMIAASAKASGDGGKVVVWSDQATAFYGTIKAQGGAQFGNGGFVETSGHQSLTFSGVVDTGALHGSNGTLLLDPLNATIDANPGSEIITVSSIQNALLTGNVVVSTNVAGAEPGNITVSAPVTWSTPNTITLNANNNIAINAALIGQNGGLTISAGTFGFAGSITATAPINVGIFTLKNGAWSQVAANLPSFFASDFRIADSSAPPGFPGPSFLRVLSGNGTSISPYQIADIYGLQGIGLSTLLGQNIVLANNIDASVTASWNGGAGFVPIGASPSSSFFLQKSFTGVFDGQNHSINNLMIASSNFDVGLFAIIGTGGVVRNVTLANASIFGVGSNNVSRDVGVLAGENDGTITNTSIVNSSVLIPSGSAGGLVGSNNGAVTQSVAFTAVTYNDPTAPVHTIGGLAGSNSGTIIQSSATGAVDAAIGLAGGLVGFNTGTISQSFASGPVHGGSFANNGQAFGSTTGGLVGQNAGIVLDAYSTGSVTSDNSGWAGGLIGFNGGSFGLNGAVVRSYATGTVSVGDGGIGGGLVGVNAGSITQTFATGPVSGGSDSLVGGLAGINSLPFSFSNAVTISQSYAIGSVSGGTNSHVGGLVADNIGGSISETYAVGPISGGGNSTVGGIVAVNSPGSNGFTGVTSPGVVTNSYWDTLGSGQSGSDGGTGQITAQLTVGLPSGFDSTVWTINQAVSYSYFPWQPLTTIPLPGFVDISPPQTSPPAPPTLPPNTPPFPTGQTIFFSPVVVEPIVPAQIIITSDVPLNYPTASNGQTPISSPYTFQVDSFGNVVTFENGVRISTGTAQNAQEQYGYNPASSSTVMTSVAPANANTVQNSSKSNAAPNIISTQPPPSTAANPAIPSNNAAAGLSATSVFAANMSISTPKQSENVFNTFSSKYQNFTSLLASDPNFKQGSTELEIIGGAAILGGIVGSVVPGAGTLAGAGLFAEAANLGITVYNTNIGINQVLNGNKLDGAQKLSLGLSTFVVNGVAGVVPGASATYKITGGYVAAGLEAFFGK